MEKELFIDTIQEAQRSRRNVIIVTEGVAGHGGYSSSSIAFKVNSTQIIPTERCIKINGLHTVRDTYNGKEDISPANPNLNDGKYSQVIIEYSRVIYIGIE